MFIFLMFPKKDNISPRIVMQKKKTKKKTKNKKNWTFAFYYYDQNSSRFRFLVQIGTFVILSSLRLPNLKWKEKQKDAGSGSKMTPSCKWPVVMWILIASRLLSFGFTETKLQHFYLHISLFANVCLRFKLNRTFYKK